MRVITGTARGRRLETLPGEVTRPTSDAVKEALFSIIQFETEGRSFLDLFAGSGQLGIEALSRGASRAVFVDSSKDAAAVIRKNVTKCGFADRSDVLCTDYRAYLSSSRESFSVILLDPPYSTGMLSDALKNSVRLLKPGGVMSLCIYYGGESGYEERDALLAYLAEIDNRNYTVIVNTFHNRTGDPPIPVFIYKEI